MFAFVHSKGCALDGTGVMASAKLNVPVPTCGSAARPRAAIAVACFVLPVFLVLCC